MESINAGTTTVVDHSHLNYAEQHRKQENFRLGAVRDHDRNWADIGRLIGL